MMIVLGFEGVPDINSLMPKVILKARRAEPFYARHPWVFAGAIAEIQGQPADGDEVQLQSSNGQFIAYGIYNSRSKLSVRLYSWDQDQPLDPPFFELKLNQAIALRHSLLNLQSYNLSAYRIVFSEADGLSGLIVDRFTDFLAIQVSSLGIARRVSFIAKILAKQLPVQGIYLRTEKGIAQLEGLDLQDQLLWGEMPPEEIIFHENSLRFAVNLTAGQKTGYYLDQRDNRLAAAKFAKGRSVLDAFCYSGGFSIYAARAGASAVMAVDASDAALKLAARNAELNQLSHIQFRLGDVFHVMDELVQSGKQFDMVILDPPKFARNRAAVPQALQGYRRLHKLALKLLPPDGILVSCCCTGAISQEQFEDVITQVGVSARRDVQILERRGPSPDHPVRLSCREGTYLKCLICRVI